MFSHNDLILPTARLTLRPLVADDAASLYTIFSDPAAMRYWSSAPWTAPEQAGHYLQDDAQQRRLGALLRLGICINDRHGGAGTLAGVCNLRDLHRQNRRCEIGYILGTPHQGRGYMGEALAALLAHGFDDLQLHRVEADVDPRNGASAALLERLGFRREGLLRERWLVNGEICDSAFYGLLKRDWQAVAG